VSGRAFEDVNVGDELDPVEVLPTFQSAVDFFGPDTPTNPAFRDAELGKAQGFGGAIVPGLWKMAWITSYVTDWAGPKAVVRTVRVAFRRPDIVDKPLTLSGKVVDKRQEDGTAVVELEVVTLAEGQPSVRGNVQVELPARG
jgi:acyl dehydratase